MSRLTPIERRMLAVLADGGYHSRAELHRCLYDTLGSLSNIRWHVMNLRRKLPEGEAIVCRKKGGVIRYRRVVMAAG